MRQPAKSHPAIDHVFSTTIEGPQRLFFRPWLRGWRNSRPNTNKTLVVAGTLLVAAILAGAAGIILDRRAAAYAAAQRESTSLAVALAEQTSRTLQGAQLDLADVVETIEAGHVTSQAELAATMGTEAVHDRLRAGISGLSQINVMAIVGADGHLISSSEYWPPPKMDLSDRGFFRALQADPLLDRFISAPVLSRGSGAWTIYVVRRINAPDGTFIGVVAGAIGLSYFDDFYRAVAEGNEIEVSLWRNDGTLMTRYPSAEREIDTALYDPKSLGSRDDASRSAALFSALRSASEHRPSVTRAVNNFQLFVTVSRTAASIRRDWWNQALAVGAGAVLSSSLLALAIASLMRQISRRAASEDALRRHRDNLEREVAERTRALAASEARHRDVAEVAVDWFWETDPERRFTFVSRRFGDAAGVPAERFIGKTIGEVTGTDIARHDHAEVRAALATRRVFNNVIQRIDLPDGRKRFWRVSGKPFFDAASGAFAGYRGSGTDVTDAVENELKLNEALSRAETAEEQARRDRAKLLDAVDVIPAAFALWDTEDRLDLCNTQFREMSEQASDLLMPGVRYEDFVRAIATRGGPVLEGQAIDAWVRQRVAKHRHPGESFVQLRTDGHWMQVDERRTADGGIVGTYSDVTELLSARSRAEAAEEQARRDRARLLDAIEVMPVGLSLWDSEDRLELCNEHFRKLFGKTGDLMVPGMRYEDLIRHGAENGRADLGGKDIDSWVAERIAVHRAVGSGFTEHRLADGRTVQAEERPTSGGGIIGIRIDVTEARKREAAEREREKLAALGQLAGGVAHEINNLLQPAIIFPELILERLPAEDMEAREDLTTILEGARKARDIVKNILRFARKEELALDQLDLVAEVASSLAFVRDLLPPTVAIKEVTQDLPTNRMVAANKTQLSQVVTNLVLNAAHAMQDRGTITVAVSERHPTPSEAEGLGIAPARAYLAVAVNDTGCGIDAATQSRIFEPFFTTKPRGQGTGLGLSVVYGILRSWGGAITVASLPGCGATFTLHIPTISGRAAS